MEERKSKPNKRQDILDAAEREFFEKGYFGATTSSIAKCAGVTHAMLHYFFQSKENLYLEVINAKMESMREMMAAMVGDGSKSVVDKVAWVVGTHFDFLRANPLMPTYFIRDILPQKDLVMRLRNLALSNVEMQRFVAEVTEASVHGEIAEISFVALVMDVMSLNLSPFLVLPTLRANGMTEEMVELFLDRRRAENIKVITKRIKK